MFVCVACVFQVLQVFRSNPSPLLLNLSYLGIQSRNAPPIFHSLIPQTTLTSLILTGNRLLDSSMQALSASLPHLVSLHTLDLSCVGITHRGLEILANMSSRSAVGQGQWKLSTLSSDWPAVEMYVYFFCYYIITFNFFLTPLHFTFNFHSPSTPLYFHSLSIFAHFQLLSPTSLTPFLILLCQLLSYFFLTPLLLPFSLHQSKYNFLLGVKSFL